MINHPPPDTRTEPTVVLGVRDILRPGDGITALGPATEVVLRIGGTTLIVTADEDGLEIRSDRDGIAVLPRAGNSVLIRPQAW